MSVAKEKYLFTVIETSINKPNLFKAIEKMINSNPRLDEYKFTYFELDTLTRAVERLEKLEKEGKLSDD